MRAARIHRYGTADELVIEEAPVPTPGRGQVLVRVICAAVNPIDWKMRSGAQAAVIRRPFPLILGLDCSGVVEAVGPGVTALAPGDEVFSSPDHKRDGTYAEFTVIPEGQLARKPASLTHAQAASLPLVGLTAWDCLVRAADLKSGEKVLIHAGSGGVGTFAIQLARHLGAEVATTCSGRNAAWVRSLGADRVVDYQQERFEDVLPPQDVILECLGGDSLPRSLTLLRRGGRLTSINSGMPGHVKRWGPVLGLVVTIALNLRVLVVQRLFRGVRYAMVLRQPDGRVLARIGELADAGAIAPQIDREVALDDIADAHRHGETGRAQGKIVVRIAPDPA